MTLHETVRRLGWRRLLVSALLLLAAVFTSSPPAPAAESLALYDDFIAATLDPTKWVAQRESLRVIQNGVLLLAHRSGAQSNNTMSTQLRHVNPPTNLTSLQADVTLSDATIPVAGAYNRIRLRGAFYNDGTVGTSSTGDVWASTGLRVGPSGTPEAWYGAFRCGDPDCNSSTNSVSGSLGPAAFNTPYTVSIAWNGSQFTFTATPVGGGTSLTQTVSAPVVQSSTAVSPWLWIACISPQYRLPCASSVVSMRNAPGEGWATRSAK